MSFFDRLMGTIGEDESRISAHQMFGALYLMSEGELTRAEVEAGFDIGTTGTDATEFGFLINKYVAAVDKQKYLNSLHAILLLVEHRNFKTRFTKSEIQTLLTSAAS